MNKRTTFVDVTVEGIIILVSAVLSCIASFLLGFFVSLFTIGIPYVAYFSSVIHAVIFVAGVFTTMSVIAYNLGYKTASSSVPRTLASFGLVYAVLLIPAFIIAVLSESTIQGALKASGIFAPRVLSIFHQYALLIFPFFALVLLFFFVLVVFALFALFRHRGAKKRLCDRKEMGIIKE